ncbi:hypothetical protein L7F22_055368 [Adiantum nelumboides]|nr:hypothetical protein [Adiantum nelumboides]
MGDAMKSNGAFIGQDVSVTPLIERLRLHIQGYVDKEDFFISPPKHEDVILGTPWFDRLAASIKFNIVAQWAAIASIDYYLAVFIQTIILLSTGGANNGGYIASKYEVLGICGGILLLHSALNSLPIGWLAYVGTFAAAWNILGVFILMFLIPLVSPTRASAKFVFQHFNKESSYQIHSSPYIFCLGLLMSQFTLAGYDAAAHMSEEAKFSDKSGPYTIISSLAISIVVGWGYLLGITFAVTDLDHVIDPGNDANGNAIAQVFYDAFKNRFGSGIGGIFCLGVVALAVFFSAMGAITATSRIIYGFSRDEAMPFSRVWHSVNRWEVPLNAVWLCTTISFILATTSLGSLVAFQALVSVATISIYITYAVPSLLRVTIARKSFVSGPLKLGVFGSICGWIAVMWVAVITVLFSLPVQYPVTSKNLNYAPVVVGGVAALGIGSWLVNARHWFKGPVANLAAHEH